MSRPSTVSSGPATSEFAWSTVQRIVIALCFVINMLDGMDVLIVSFIAPSLAEDWQISGTQLGLVFSAGLAGMMIGSLAIAPLADRFGRKPLIVTGLTLITLGMIGSGFADGLIEFSACRVIAGLGIGSLLASIAAMAAEFAPPGRSSVAVGIFQAGYPIGAVFTGFATIAALKVFSWQAILIGAGLCSAVVLPFAIFLLPESPVFLANKGTPAALEKLRALRQRMILPEEDPQSTGDTRKGGNLADLFAGNMWKATALLWCSTFLSYGVLYFVSSWVPKLAIETGLSPDNALYAGTLFNLGGFVGALSIGWLATRISISRLIFGYFVGAAIAMMVFVQPMALVAILAVAIAMGLMLQGGFSGYYSLTAALYPARVRSSGIGWAVGVGRGGSVVGPLAGGLLIDAGLPLWIIFLCFAVPLVIAGLLLLGVRVNAEAG